LTSPVGFDIVERVKGSDDALRKTAEWQRERVRHYITKEINMSKTIIGEIKIDPSWKVYGTYPSHAYTIDPAKVSALDGQRDTDAKTLKKVLKECDGLHRAMVDPITIAVFPRNYVPTKNDPSAFYWGFCPAVGEERLMALLDGDHRRHLHLLFKLAEVPCAYVPMTDEKEYSRAYVRRNSRCRKTQNAEEIFVMEVNADDPDALRIEKELKKSGLHVSGGSAEESKKGDVSGPSVKIGAFRRAVSRLETNGYSLTWLYEAAGLIRSEYPDAETVHNNLLEGLTLFLSEYGESGPKSVWTTAMRKDFGVWFHNRTMKSQKKLSQVLMKEGGSVHNAQAESVALGMVREYRNEDTGKITLAYKRKLIHESVIKKVFPKKK
tara:strand:+ start:451 stop:1587 length:1137 start_codon:yes stop_codon:yes gene_type:complete